MAIFNNEKNHNYNAYLNWMFDDGYGGMDGNPTVQTIWDLKTLGRAYLENSRDSLALLLAQKNNGVKADMQIFPILFSIWHGLELVLKSGNMLCDLYLHENQGYSTHKIDAYLDQFLAKLKKLGLTKAKRTHLSEVVSFVDECKEKDAHFDFARYTEQSNGDKQFYNKPDDSGIVQNMRVDMIELYRVVDEIIKKSVDCVDFLFDYLTMYGTEDKRFLTNEQLQDYTKQDEELDKQFPKEENLISLIDQNAKNMIEIVKNLDKEAKEKS